MKTGRVAKIKSVIMLMAAESVDDHEMQLIEHTAVELAYP